MLQKVDQERLVALKKSVEKLAFRFPVTKIAEELGYDKGVVSSYLSGKKPISDNFLEAFYNKFHTKEISNNQVVNQENIDMLTVASLADSNKILAASNKVIAESHKIIAESNADLVALVKKFSSDGGIKTPVDVESILPQLLELVAEASQGNYKSVAEAEAALRRKFFGNQKKHTRSDVGK